LKEQGGMQYVEVNVRRISSGKEGEHSGSQIEVIGSLMRLGGMQYDFILCKMRVVG
jgi:hypothetical protein